MKNYVLDTYALIAFFNDEVGADIVEKLFADAIMKCYNNQFLIKLSLYKIAINIVRRIIMRANVVVNDDLMQRAMTVSGYKTKQEVIKAAIIEFVDKREPKNIFELARLNILADDYDYKKLREGRNYDID